MTGDTANNKEDARASEIVHRAIPRRFAAGESGPAPRLPAENLLAGVYLPTVRKMLLRMRGEGNIEPRRGTGSDARQKRQRSIPDAINEEGEIERLLACHSELEAAARRNGAPAFEKADFDFHRQIALLSRNTYFAEAINQKAKMIRCTQRPAANLPPGQRRLRFSETIAEHAEIISAIRKRSSMETSDAMKQHLSNARRHLRQGGGAT